MGAFGALLLVVFGGLVLFRAVALAVIGFFAEDVVEAVERCYYSARAESAVPPSAWRGLKIGLRSALRAILWNLIALPLYFALLITAVGAPMVFLIVNAFLIGKFDNTIRQIPVAFGNHPWRIRAFAAISQSDRTTPGIGHAIVVTHTPMLLLPAPRSFPATPAAPALALAPGGAESGPTPRQA